MYEKKSVKYLFSILHGNLSFIESQLITICNDNNIIRISDRYWTKYGKFMYIKKKIQDQK